MKDLGDLLSGIKHEEWLASVFFLEKQSQRYQQRVKNLTIFYRVYTDVSPKDIVFCVLKVFSNIYYSLIIEMKLGIVM